MYFASKLSLPRISKNIYLLCFAAHLMLKFLIILTKFQVLVCFYFMISLLEVWKLYIVQKFVNSRAVCNVLHLRALNESLCCITGHKLKIFPAESTSMCVHCYANCWLIDLLIDWLIGLFLWVDWWIEWGIGWLNDGLTDELTWFAHLEDLKIAPVIQAEWKVTEWLIIILITVISTLHKLNVITW